ncbi:MAG TPA: Gfo/Idh/MocA family oxidoreductase, partial [bacterium]|nr:Gfo/Idh/MocA family oxidoreductase [bacterium]
MLRIGLAGAGFVAEIHAHALRHLNGRARITAVAAQRPERARTFAERHGLPVSVPSYADLLARDDVDVVDL